MASRYQLIGLLHLILQRADQAGSDVDPKDSHGRTPLSYAARYGHEAVVKLLLATGKVDIDSKAAHDKTPLLFAAQYGHEAVVKLLLATGKVDINIDDNYWQTPLSHAAQNGHEAVVKLLFATGKANVNVEDRCRETPRKSAAFYKHEAVVKLLDDYSESVSRRGMTRIGAETGSGDAFGEPSWADEKETTEERS